MIEHRKPMRFRIGPHRYLVAIVPGLRHDGEPVAGLIRERQRRILINADEPVSHRLDVLIHELRHAWQFHIGIPADPEGEANNAASFFVAVLRQLQRQGGEAALRAMEGEATP